MDQKTETGEAPINVIFPRYHSFVIEKSDVILSRILIKTERAKKHLGEVESFAREARQGIGSFPNGKSKRRKGEPILVVDIGAISGAGDAIHNLRSALDHLAWELAKWETGLPINPEACCFPIGKSSGHYKSIKRKGVITGMSPKAEKVIDDLRPYKGGNEPLWRIHHFDIVDKHRHLLVAGYKVVFSGTGLPGTLSFVKDEPAYFLGLFDEDLKSENNSSPQPTPMELEISHMKPLVPSLHELLIFTEDLIKNFKPFLGERKK